MTKWKVCEKKECHMMVRGGVIGSYTTEYTLPMLSIVAGTSLPCYTLYLAPSPLDILNLWYSNKHYLVTCDSAEMATGAD